MRRLFERLLAGRLSLTVVLLIFLALWGFLIGPIRSLSNDILIGGAFSLLVLSLITFTFYLITLWLAGPHVLPINLRDRTVRNAARRVLRRYALGNDVLMAVVREGAVLPAANGERREGAGGQGVIDIDSTSVVVLSTNTGLSRIKGPGIVFTRDAEKIGSILDLRIQARSQEFEYITRDGIPIKVGVSVRFQIDQTQFIKELYAFDRAVPYPPPVAWSQHAVRRALGLSSVGQPAGEVTRWQDVPLGLAAGMLRSIIADYTFDGLTEPQEPTKDPRQEIKDKLEKGVREGLVQYGIKVLGVGLGIFFPHDFNPDKTFDPQNPETDKITAQRVKAWRAEWESRTFRARGEAQAESVRLYHQARIQAQMELITRVMQALEQGAPAATADQDVIAQRFMETLKDMAAEPYTHARLSAENLRLIGMGNPEDRLESHEPPAKTE